MDDGNALAKAEQLKKRAKQFALRVIQMFRAIPNSEEGRIIGRQVLRSATSVGANYRAVCRARSRREFISKMNVVVEEADETLYWFELLVEGGVMGATELGPLIQEGTELLSIFAASLRTAKKAARSHSDSISR